jgi:hypothetical protein
MRIVEYINKNSWLIVNEKALIFKIARQEALKEIGKMIELEIVKREGT